MNTTETQHGGVITRTQIEQIQVLGRDVTSLMRLLPGVRYTAPVDSMGGTFGVDVPNVGGLPADWSNVIIDGVVGNEAGNSGMNAQMVNLDAIAEVRLLNNSYRAEYGQSGGSQLQIVTRGGSPEYRGSRLLLRPPREVQQHRVLPCPFAAAAEHRSLPAQVPLRHLWRQHRRPGAEEKSKPLLLLLDGSAAGAAPAERADLAHAVGAGAAGGFLADVRRAGRLINIRDPRKVGLACSATTGGLAASTATSSRRR